MLLALGSARGQAGSAVFPDGTWEIVIVDDGKQIKAMNATPGIAVEAVLTKL
jgi:hypothetical protein